MEPRPQKAGAKALQVRQRRCARPVQQQPHAGLPALGPLWGPGPVQRPFFDLLQALSSQPAADICHSTHTYPKICQGLEQIGTLAILKNRLRKERTHVLKTDPRHMPWMENTRKTTQTHTKLRRRARYRSRKLREGWPAPGIPADCYS